MEKVIVIVGPTGIGKTDISLKVAKKTNGEIISGDSMQVYKGMDIGTAKIKNKKGVIHHLIDIKEIREPYSVFENQKNIRKKIKEIRKKNKTPIIVGGTGLYLKSALYDYKFIEENKKRDYLGYKKEELLELLRKKDAKTYEKIDKENKRRILRALQIAEQKPKSEILENQNKKPIYDLKIIGLTTNREELYKKINKRVDDMLNEGLLKEAKQIYFKYKDMNLTSLQAIGYKEFFPYFEKKESLESCVEKLKQKTRNYAKKQYTWFNNQLDVKWFEKKDQMLLKKIMEHINE